MSELLKVGLFKLCFKKIKIDSCLFSKEDMICAIYVDDIIFLSSNDINIDITISEFWALTFDLTDKRGVESFLGIKTNTNDDGMITMSNK